MKLLLRLALLIGGFPLFAQQITPPTPPNTVQVGTNLYVDKTEVANLHWLEFLYYIRRDSGEAYYRQMLPDTSVWVQRTLVNPQTPPAELIQNYLRAPQYRTHPVVGISYEQAQAYARWRSRAVNQAINQPRELAALGLQGRRIVVEYRLPTEEEWMQAAAGTRYIGRHPYGFREKEFLVRASKRIDPQQAWEGLADPRPSRKAFSRSLRKTYLPLFQVVASLPADLHMAPEFPLSTTEGLQNSLGLLHSIGNVAEMILGPGQAKGGSFMHPLEASKISDMQRYVGPAPWLGLRLVASVQVE
ncbi:SUMF1/EgtB/PvdO family nonheme iron enzyme [Cesiribacter andamanensis]|uniref:Gliding motility-associated lipoprotein GldJ n=1 Tax=Cesiribacter andamanensis AMV16 TaxID=1279009 RepID=M7NTY4_9BACT|nr:SUMF1/EgtB/PvdO family nonheme iron enzyme [Cesiribacter andamanensis]EMR01944.1 gliding motility-associated lipoprotein GldJ [Cesiribacter andamanensis AMV16]